MGMGTAGAYADMIEQEDLLKVCPKTGNNFLETLIKLKTDFDSFAQVFQWANTPEKESLDLTAAKFKKLVEAWEALKKDFKRKTKLELDVVYHSDDDGDIYDDFRGAGFCVDGVYVESEASKNTKKKYDVKIVRNHWTTFG